MTTFSTTRVDVEAEAARAAMAQRVGHLTKENGTLIGGGRNNQVYRVVAEGGKAYAWKFYFRGSRDRLATEYKGLEFLRSQGIDCVPEPVFMNPHDGWALYEYIVGSPIAPATVQDADIDAAVEFLWQLRELALKPASRVLGPASEACFSLQEARDQIVRRYERLREAGYAVAGSCPPSSHMEMQRFLSEEFQPVREELEHWSVLREAELAVGKWQTLPDGQRTLSPSDFGFHNALRRPNGPNGTLVFLDFEYFGWDDPAKMAIDFLLHPEMNLSSSHRARFLAALLKRFQDSGELLKRIQIVYPLFGLKWCLILLNEFLPGQMARRKFASSGALKPEPARADQLKKAKWMLARVKETYEHVPDF